jgi:DNA-binding transcriptional LysR family regulator
MQEGSTIQTFLAQVTEKLGKPLKLRIQLSSFDAMCRMIDNGLGVGLLPDRAFALMRGVGHLAAVPLRDAWAQRELRLVARDFAALPPWGSGPPGSCPCG